MELVDAPTNLTGRLGRPITVASVGEVVVVEAVIAFLTTATKEKVGNPYSKQVDTLKGTSIRTSNCENCVSIKRSTVSGSLVVRVRPDPFECDIGGIID